MCARAHVRSLDRVEQRGVATDGADVGERITAPKHIGPVVERRVFFDRYVATAENAAQWAGVFTAVQHIMGHFETTESGASTNIIARFGYAVMPGSTWPSSPGSGWGSGNIAYRSRAQQRALFAAIEPPRISSTAPPDAVETGDFALLIEKLLGPQRIARDCGERSTVVHAPHCIIVLITGETSPAFGQGYQSPDNRFDVLALAHAIDARRLAMVGSGGSSIATSIIGVPLGTSASLYAEMNELFVKLPCRATTLPLTAHAVIDSDAVVQSIVRAICTDAQTTLTPTFAPTVSPTPAPTRPPTRIPLCTPPPKVDLFFVLDVSGSIGGDNFALMKQFVVDILTTFTISDEYARVGLMTFADNTQRSCVQRTNAARVNDLLDRSRLTPSAHTLFFSLALRLRSIFAAHSPASPRDDHQVRLPIRRGGYAGCTLINGRAADDQHRERASIPRRRHVPR